MADVQLPSNPEVIHACVIANATGVETKKMKAISDVKEQDLDRFNRSYIRYQTLSGGRMLNGKTEIELGINAESIRLIANAVIF